MSILLAVPNLGKIRTDLVKFLIKADKRDNVETYFSRAKPVDVNRNKITNYFLEETDHDWLLMIDADIVPPDNVFEIPEEFGDKDILTPLIFSMKDGIPYPVATDLKDTPDGKRLKMSTGEPVELLEIDGIGTGCIFIKREVFEDMEQPIFEFSKNDKGEVDTGEDFNFCLKVKDRDYKIFMALNYVCGHQQNVDLKRMMELLYMAIQADEEKVFYKEVRERGDE